MTTLNTTTLASKQINQVIEQISNMNNDDTISLYNNYADINSYERIYYNDDDNINDVFHTPRAAIRAATYGRYNVGDDYFFFDSCAHMISFNSLNDNNSPIVIEELAQWIIDNELFSDYDIDVTTLDDMLASIEDNITDDEEMLNKLTTYLNIPLYYQCFDGSDDNKVSEVMSEISYYNYNQLNDIITHLGINYNK